MISLKKIQGVESGVKIKTGAHQKQPGITHGFKIRWQSSFILLCPGCCAGKSFQYPIANTELSISKGGKTILF